MNLNKNTILVTGGTSGIGLELAKQLIKLGNTVIVTGRNPERLAQAKITLPQVHVLQSDVTKPGEIAMLFDQVTREFPALNILINNAGVMREINLNKLKVGGSEDLTTEIDSNLKGPIWMIEKFLPFLKTKPSAAIVNVSSGLAFVPLPSSPVYCATKAALHSFTQSLRVQLKRTNVKVFELAPPATETPLLKDWKQEDRKGVSMMNVDDMVRVAIHGMQTDTFEIRPGQSNQLKMMSRVAPAFILKMLSKPMEKMLDQ
jgi:uncharacterized oxidoreductase